IFTNLKILFVSNCYLGKSLILRQYSQQRWGMVVDGKERVEKGIYNRFTGSLESLKNMSKLNELDISNTDIDSGLEYLPDSVGFFYCFSEDRPESKVKKIEEQLKNFELKNLEKLKNFASLAVV